MNTRGSRPAFDRRFETGSYALIHAHFGTDAVYAVPFARRHRLPLVVTFHGFDVPLLGSAERLVPMYWPYGMLGPSMLRQLGARLCASVELYEMLRELGVPADRLRVHRMGLTSVASRAPARKTDMGDGAGAEPVVVMVGRFVHKKGLVYGIRAFAEARRAHGRGRPAIVGDGPLQPQLEAAVREADAADHVTFAGALPHAEVAALLATADVLMAPSVTTANGDRESGTMVVKEASASGVVPLCTWHGGLPGHCRRRAHRLSGPRTRRRRAGAPAAATARRPDLRRRFAEAGRAKMLAEYDNRLRVAALEDAYDQVLASRGSASHPSSAPSSAPSSSSSS